MMEERKYREGLPRIPERIKRLPVDSRGYPIPWFVAEIDGKRDFRIVSQEKMFDAVTKKLCWVCGDKLGATLAFPIGPMCAINRTIGEPPSHRECAEFSIVACPFLNQSEIKRRETGLPDRPDIFASEHGLKRQPGAICLWICRFYRPFYANGPGTELLFRIGKPDAVYWYCQGRPATRAEVMHSIDTGLPILREMAEAEGYAAVAELERKTAAAMEFVPPENPKRRGPLFGSAARRVI